MGKAGHFAIQGRLAGGSFHMTVMQKDLSSLGHVHRS